MWSHIQQLFVTVNMSVNVEAVSVTVFICVSQYMCVWVHIGLPPVGKAVFLPLEVSSSGGETGNFDIGDATARLPHQR